MIQCLQRWTDRWYLQWVERLRPFYEAYTGPCNDSYRFWPGLLYILRSGLYALELTTQSYVYHIKHLKMIATSLVCVVIMLLSIMIPHGVYKKWYLNVLEFSIFLNLCITCGVWGFGRINHSFYFAHVSVVIVMLTCFGILLYHTLQRIKTTCGWIKLTKWLKALKQHSFRIKNFQEKNPHHQESDSEDMPFLPQPLPSVIKGSGSYEPYFRD